MNIQSTKINVCVLVYRVQLIYKKYYGFKAFSLKKYILNDASIKRILTKGLLKSRAQKRLVN
jgi:hypothetical protein